MTMLRRARKDTSMAALVAAHQRHVALEGSHSSGSSSDDSDEEQKQDIQPKKQIHRQSPHLHPHHHAARALDPFDERDEERHSDDTNSDDEEEWPASNRSQRSPHHRATATTSLPYYRHDSSGIDNSNHTVRQRAVSATPTHSTHSPHSISPSAQTPSHAQHNNSHRIVRFSESATLTYASGADRDDVPADRQQHATRTTALQDARYITTTLAKPTHDHLQHATAHTASALPAATDDPRPLLRPGAKVSAALRKPMQLMRERTSVHRRARTARPIDAAMPCTSQSSSDNSAAAPLPVDALRLGLVAVDANMIRYIDETLVKPNTHVFNCYTRFFLDATLELLYQDYTAVSWFPRARWHIALLMLVHLLVLLLFCVLPSSGFQETDQFVLSPTVATTFVQGLYLLVAVPFALLPSHRNPFQQRWRVWACVIVVVFNVTFQLWLAHAGQLAIRQFTHIVDTQLECSALNGGVVMMNKTVRASPNGSAIGNTNSSSNWLDPTDLSANNWTGPTTIVNVSRPLTLAELTTKTHQQRTFVNVSTQLFASALTQILTSFAWLFSFIFVISIRLEFVHVVVVGISAVATYGVLIAVFHLPIEWLTTFAFAFALALLMILSRAADLTNRRSFLSTFVVERENESLKSSLTKAEAALLNEPAGAKEKQVVEQVLDVPEMRALESFRIPFADLKFLEAIGRGAMGDVIKAKYLGTTVVCKRLRREHITAAALESFREEVALMACLRHPNIVQFIGASWDNYSNLCIVMEYLENGDVHSVLNSTIGKRFTWADPLLKMALDIVQGMLYLHSQEPPIVHRDLKSVNVLCSKTYGCNVGDFGLSRRYNRGDVNPLKTLVGTPFWLAPEIIRNDRYGPAADVYSFGIVLTELEARKAPYHELGELANRGVKVLMRIAYDGLRPTLPSTCLPHRRQLITDCLRATPAQRPTFAAILARLQGDVQREVEEDATRCERRTMPKQSHVAALA